MYAKIIKYTSWVLLAIGVALFAYVFISPLPEVKDIDDAAMCQPVNMLIWYTYIMVALTLVAVVLVGIIIGALVNPKGLLKTGLIVLGGALIVFGAYCLAPGTAIEGLALTADKLPTPGELKLTDTVLILTYFSVGAAVLSLIVGGIMSAVRK